MCDKEKKNTHTINNSTSWSLRSYTGMDIYLKEPKHWNAFLLSAFFFTASKTMEKFFKICFQIRWFRHLCKLKNAAEQKAMNPMWQHLLLHILNTDSIVMINIYPNILLLLRSILFNFFLRVLHPIYSVAYLSTTTKIMSIYHKIIDYRPKMTSFPLSSAFTYFFLYCCRSVILLIKACNCFRTNLHKIWKIDFD